MTRRRRWKSLRALGDLARMGFASDVPAALAAGVSLPFDLIGGAMQALALKALADAAVGQDLTGVWVAAAALTLVSGGRSAASTAWFAARTKLGELSGMAMQRRLAALTAAIPTIEHFERPDYLRQLDLLKREGGALGQLPTEVVQHLSRLGRLGVSVALLSGLHPLLIVLPLFGLPSLLATRWSQGVRRALDDAVAEPRRLENHLQTLAWGESSGKEVRVFGLADELLARHVRTRAVVDEMEARGAIRMTLATTAGWLVFALGFAGAIAFVVVEAAAGRATVGDVVLALALAGQMNGIVSELAGTVGWVSRSLAVAERYLWLTEYAEGDLWADGEPAPIPERLEREITLEGVTFTYPGTDRVVLRDVSLDLPAGSTVALVGENGAGKTTLVKLLCGLYRPTAGRVLIDGVDLRRLDVAAWRRRTSAGFQDFARFMFLVRESVGVGDVSRVEEPAAVEAAIDRAHASDVLATLPQGLDTQLGRYFAPGVGAVAASGMALSDGQWQKLALGRAMMRPEPLLLALDEPTASLDAPSEHALFEHYAGAARRAATANGGITVLVSHRFSTVRMADLIVVLENGGVAAVGTHEQLTAEGGLYAELYELQARAFRA